VPARRADVRDLGGAVRWHEGTGSDDDPAVQPANRSSSGRSTRNPPRQRFRRRARGARGFVAFARATALATPSFACPFRALSTLSPPKAGRSRDSLPYSCCGLVTAR